MKPSRIIYKGLDWLLRVNGCVPIYSPGESLPNIFLWAMYSRLSYIRSLQSTDYISLN